MNQKERVLKHLKQGNSVTCLDAFQILGITQLAARIFELKREGHPIIKSMREVTNRFDEPCHVAEYRYLEVTNER